jgi:hypothetical protein
MVALTQAPKAPDKPRHLTDQDLVAAFPKGSCFIAEVDGRKELVFFDPEVERTYVARLGARSKSTTSGKAGGLTEVERLKAAWPFGR